MTTFNSIMAKSIPNGTKFVAFYSDGSGCDLFWINDSGELFDVHCDYLSIAPDQYLMDRGFSYWIEIPNKYQFWFEIKDEAATENTVEGEKDGMV
jgi:hypothetical protein